MQGEPCNLEGQLIIGFRPLLGQIRRQLFPEKKEIINFLWEQMQGLLAKSIKLALQTDCPVIADFISRRGYLEQ